MIPPAVIERGVRVAEGAHVGSLVVLGEDVAIGAGSTVERAVILQRDRDRRGLRRCATASSRAGCRDRRAHHRSPAARCSARA